MQTRKECLYCRTSNNLHSHHIFFGTANRKLSEKRGLKVWLCMEHHTGPDGVHFNPERDRRLKQVGQLVYEKKYGTRDDFIKEFGRSYL